MEIRVLGPMEVADGGRQVDLAGPKQRAVLALLALNANITVSLDRLIDGLWGDEPPASAAKMVQLYVSQLRRLLNGGAALMTHGRDYELRIDPDEVDAARFERLIGEEGADAALALWRGPPLADLAKEPFAAAERRRLEALRLVALELAIEAELETGRHPEVIGRLESLVAEHPLSEHLHGLRMLALYRGGRQAEALEAYRTARAALVGEAGVEPGPELRRLHEAILHQDPSLDLADLPAELADSQSPLAGRRAELDRLRAAWRAARDGTGRAVLLHGPRGIGKTRLAAELASEVHAEGASVGYGRARRHGLVVFDDLDRAPPEVVQRAAQVARSAPERPILAVLVYRDDPPPAALSRLARELPQAERIRLRPLGADEVRRIAAS